MRSCPICNSPHRNVLMDEYDHTNWELYQCSLCSMKYLDLEHVTQESMNEFYQHHYKTDDAPYSEERLESLAARVARISMTVPIMDIGGKDRVLAGKLKEHGCEDVSTSDAGDVLNRKYGIFILSHTLEHIYDTHAMLENIKANIQNGGYVVVEVPIWDQAFPLTYDLHFQHCNKFTPAHLEDLFINHGFEIVHSTSLPSYREYLCHRLIARLGHVT